MFFEELQRVWRDSPNAAELLRTDDAVRDLAAPATPLGETYFAVSPDRRDLFCRVA